MDEHQEPTEKQVVDYCHKRCLVIVEEELFQRMKATFSQLPKKGEWIIKPHGTYGQLRAFCSACGKHSGIGGIVSNQKKPYCPNCGARMKGANDEADC